MPRVDRILRNAILAIRRWDPNSKIILFGSRARGDHLKDSDYDLIVVSSKFEGVSFTKRMVMLTKKIYEQGARGSFELLCYTPEEFKRKKKELGTVSSALSEERGVFRK